ncbi:MAG: hypothetical protein ACK5A0_13470 [Polaromonas sp.]
MPHRCLVPITSCRYKRFRLTPAAPNSGRRLYQRSGSADPKTTDFLNRRPKLGLYFPFLMNAWTG